jgi:hypothetical protein
LASLRAAVTVNPIIRGAWQEERLEEAAELDAVATVNGRKATRTDATNDHLSGCLTATL